MISALNSPVLLLVISLLLGAIVGLERENSFGDSIDKNKNLGGLRTFALISLVGGLVGLLPNENISLVISIFFFILLTASYVASSIKSEFLGITTEMAAISMYILSYALTQGIFSIQVCISLTVILVLVLSLKTQVHNFILGITQKEINAYIGFAIIALVIFPFLPNKYYFLSDIPSFSYIQIAFNINPDFINSLDIFNPSKIWFYVVLISGVEVIGYILNKIAGKKDSLYISSILAGFVSSVPVNLNLAIKSKKAGTNTNELLYAAILSNTASQTQLLFLITPLNPKLVLEILPLTIGIILIELVLGKIISLSKQRKISTLLKQTNEFVSTEETEIFNLKLALKMTFIIVLVSLFTKISLVLLGTSGFIASSMLSSLAGTDAVIINLAQITEKNINMDMARLTFLAIIGTSLASKSLLSFFNGSREYAKKHALVSAVVVVVTLFLIWTY